MGGDRDTQSAPASSGQRNTLYDAAGRAGATHVQQTHGNYDAKEEPHANYALWATVTCHCRLADCDKRASLRVLAVGVAMHVGYM